MRASSRSSLAIPRLGELPKNVKVRVEYGKFDEAANAMLDEVEGKGSHLAPSFTLIDPFGFSDTPMSVVSRVLKQPSAEILITVMLENINRFLAHQNPKVQARYDELFGDQGWRALTDRPNRFDALGNFYRECLLANGAKYVWAFRMIDDGNRPIYDLFFATQKVEGLKKIKRAMWSVDPAGGFRFSDRAADASDLTLFGPDPDLSSLRRALVREFGGTTKHYYEIEEWVLVETPFHDGHIKTKCLKVLEGEDKLEYLPPLTASTGSKRRKGTFPERDCRIVFRADSA